jgi:hypothetical protein
MADDIIDLSSILECRGDSDAPAGTMALWGADGERSRLALPLWRVVHLTGADRGLIFWRPTSVDRSPRPFIALHVASDPARLEILDDVTVCDDHTSGQLHNHGPQGLVVCLGARDGRVWALVADGGTRHPPLSPRKREDILFLAGECAGLLFMRDFADEGGE